MDFEQFVASLTRQFAVIWQAPIPFLVAVIFVGFAIWRAMEWRYSARIERLVDDVAWAKGQLERSAPSHTPPRPSSTGAIEISPKYDAEPQIEATAERERVFLPDNITLLKLSDMRVGSTSIQSDRLLISYYGQWLHFEGTVTKAGVEAAEIYLNLRVGEPSSLRAEMSRQVTVWFKTASVKLEAVQNGDFVSGVGKLEQVSGFGITLIECEMA